MTILGVPLNTLINGGILASILTLIGAGWRVWVTGIPERLRVRIEGRQQEITVTEQRLKEFRDEVHGYKNQVAVLLAAQRIIETTSNQRGERIRMMAFVLRMVMGELCRLDPESSVLIQARSLLEGDWDASGDSPTMVAAKHTLEAAEETVAEVTRQEEGEQK